MCSYLQQANLTVARRFAVPNSVAAITALVSSIQVDIERYTSARRYAEVHVFHNRPHAPVGYKVARQRLLPLDSMWRTRLEGFPWPNARLAEVLGDAAASLPALVHEHLFISLYKACAESLASENTSRLEAISGSVE